MIGQDDDAMTSNRPYMVRAFYEWISDNQRTPYVVVNATFPGVDVPPQTIRDGKVVFNIDMQAVSGLELGNEWISFKARFSGVSQSILFPVEAILAIYAQESGQGMAFPEEEPSASAGTPEPDTSSVGEKATPRRPEGSKDKPGKKKGKAGTSHLKIVK